DATDGVGVLPDSRCDNPGGDADARSGGWGVLRRGDRGLHALPRRASPLARRASDDARAVCDYADCVNTGARRRAGCHCPLTHGSPSIASMISVAAWYSWRTCSPLLLQPEKASRMCAPITVCCKTKRLGQQWFGRFGRLAARGSRHFGAPI